MPKCKRMIVILIVTIITTLSICPTFATESHSISVINTVGLNNIHIELNQYDIINGQKNEIETNPTVVPAQTINRTCEISNLANDAWIRAKIVYANDAPNVGESFLTIASEKWKKIGEYYYYTESVPYNNTITLFNKINIPTEWDNTYSNKTINFTVYADAVQTKNFTPDFNNEDPWFGTIIEHRIHDDYIVPTNKENLFQVIYKDGAEGLIKIGDDFFSNWGALMPGDKVKDKVLLKNNYNLPVTLYFQINTIDNTKFIEKLQIKIYTKEKEIYNGSLIGDISNEIILATINKGDEQELFYELTVPPELTNEFSLAKTRTEWIFRAYCKNMPDPSPDATSNITPNPTPNQNNNFFENTPIKTGDIPMIILVGITIMAGIIALYIAFAKGGRKNDKN